MTRQGWAIAGSFGVLLVGCMEPNQMGGLGVFNPSGFAGRLALASRVNGSAAPRTSSATTCDRHPSSASSHSPEQGSVVDH